MSENHSAEYIKSILPDKIGKTRPNSRNAENLVTTKCRTETYRACFIPFTTRVWNELPKGSRNMEYVSEKLKIKPNLLLYEGLQMQFSKLNAHIFLAA